jgi:hypothetical protein
MPRGVYKRGASVAERVAQNVRRYQRHGSPNGQHKAEPSPVVLPL